MKHVPSCLLIAGWLAIGLPHPAAAVTTHAGTLPAQLSEAMALSDDDPPVGFAQISRCLTQSGFRQAAPAKYLVQFSRTVRPRKTLILTGEGEERPGRAWKSIRSGKYIDTATLVITDTRSGDLLFRAETSRKMRRISRGGTSVDEMCDTIVRAGLVRAN